jgi:pyruvate ferredoxin oxidoreductase gamma subunit
MIEIRIHGRGGQGSVIAAEIIAKAAVKEGKYGQSFPMFGPERRGAPVQAFARISEEEIRIRGMIHEPDVVIVLDRKLLDVVDVGDGLKEEGILIINSPSGADMGKRKVVSIDATKIAIECIGRPITNTPMLGAFSKATGLIKIDTLEEVIREEFNKELAEKNVKAVRLAWEMA